MALNEECDWCEGGAFDLVYNLNNHDVHGEIDKESGIMSLWYGGKIVGSRRVNYCPMCGRPVGGKI